jgi:hypothetical protein
VARRVAASVLLIGGAAAFGASFLPFWQAACPATAIDPAVVILHVPAQNIVDIVQDNLRDPASAGFGNTAFLAFLVWGVPLILVALAVAALLMRRRMPGMLARVLTLLFVIVGLGFTLVSCLGYLNPVFGSQGATRSLSYGAGTQVVGYLDALVDVIWLSATSTRSQR